MIGTIPRLCARFARVCVPFARPCAPCTAAPAPANPGNRRKCLISACAPKNPPTLPLAALLIAASLALPAPRPAHADPAPLAAPPSFPVLRELSLSQARQIALSRSSAMRLAAAKLGQSKAALGEAQRRLSLSTAGGFDPIDGRVRYYLNLDLQRLLQLNGSERQTARLAVQSGQIGAEEAEQATQRAVTIAWYALQKADTGQVAARRYKDTATALHVAADARFRAGQGELSSVLASLRGTWEADTAEQAADQAVTLACLDLAQACGFSTAEEMEAALRAGKVVPR